MERIPIGTGYVYLQNGEIELYENIPTTRTTNKLARIRFNAPVKYNRKYKVYLEEVDE